MYYGDILARCGGRISSTQQNAKPRVDLTVNRYRPKPRYHTLKITAGMTVRVRKVH